MSQFLTTSIDNEVIAPARTVKESATRSQDCACRLEPEYSISSGVERDADTRYDTRAYDRARTRVRRNTQVSYLEDLLPSTVRERRLSCRMPWRYSKLKAMITEMLEDLQHNYLSPRRKRPGVLFLKCFETVPSCQHCTDYNTTSARLSKRGATPAAQVSGGQIPPTAKQGKGHCQTSVTSAHHFPTSRSLQTTRQCASPGKIQRKMKAG